MDVQVIRTPGLGDSTYLLTHEGLGLVVDPQRDVDRFHEAITDASVDLRFVLETHLHNDYISGGQDLARSTGAELVLPAAAAPAYRHRAAYHLEEIEGEAFTIRPIHTPGHTPEHTSYLVLIDGQPVAVFSGGSLLVGSAGRPDLLGPERADSLARLQYRSVHRLAELPDEVELFPTHGAGSFCSVSTAGKHTSTIADEKKSNPVLAYPNEESFVAGQLGGLVPYPTYYRHMGPANTFGEEPLQLPQVPTLTAEGVNALNDTVWVVDARPKPEFAAGHLSGSIAIELRNDFGVWAGWVLPFDAPIVIVMNESQDLEEALRQLGRIGFVDIRGVIRDLPDMGLPMDSYRLVDSKGFAEAVEDGAQILDVRAPNEWEFGTIEGSVLSYVPDVAQATPDDLERDREVWVACETGYRAAIAASFLQSRGFKPVVVADGGVPEALQALAATDAKPAIAG